MMKSDRIATSCARLLLRRRKLILLLVALLLVTGLFLCLRLRVDPGLSGKAMPVDGLTIVDDGVHGDIIAVGLEAGARGPEDAQAALDRLVSRLEPGDAWWNLRVVSQNAAGRSQGLFISPDGSCLTVLLDLKPGAPASEWYPFLRSLRASFPGIHISGSPYLVSFIDAEIVREAPLFVVAASILLFFVYLGLFRTLGNAFRLWLASFIPAVLTAAVFPLIGRAMTVYGVIAPVFALAVSTEYAVHATRGLEQTGGDLAAMFSLKAQVIFLDYATTVLGFLTLVFTPDPALSLLGMVAIIGTTFAFLSGFFILPLTDPRLSKAAADGSAPRAGETRDSIAATPRRPILYGSALCLFAILALCLSGWGRLGIRASASETIFPRQDTGSDAAYLEKRYGSLDEVVLHVDTGREYGLVDRGLFRALADFRGKLASDSAVMQVYDYTDAVRATLSSLPGASGEPRDDSEIGEALELFGSSSLSSFEDMLVDKGWRTASIRIRLKPGYEARATLSSVSRWEREARESHIAGRLSWSGNPVSVSAGNILMVRSQFLGMAFYFAFLFALLAIVCKSAIKSLFIVLPPLMGMIVAVGVAGMLSWPLDAGTAIVLAIIAGIGIDYSILFVLAKRRTRLVLRYMVESTVVLVLTLSSLLVSVFTPLVHVYVLVSVGLIFNTAAILVLLPAWESLATRSGVFPAAGAE